VRDSAAAAPTTERLTRADEQLELTLEELRLLGRGLHPRVLTEHGLERAIASLAEGFPVPVGLTVTTGTLPPTIESAVYFVCAEALANAAKHASANEVSVQVRGDGDAVSVLVEDNGAGGADPAGGSGLRGMADRIAALGGTLSVDSAGGGTRIAAEIPLGGDRQG
jgi:signal transduction histidine kinase